MLVSVQLTLFDDSDDPIFLSTATEIWAHITLWTMFFCGAVFYAAGLWGCRAGKQLWHKWIWLPLSSACVGAGLGFFQGTLSALLVAAIYTSIPYDVGIDTAAGMGIGQAVIITYFHLGRGDFVHR